jgi:hypothetical protein
MDSFLGTKKDILKRQEVAPYRLEALFILSFALPKELVGRFS